LGAIIKFNNYVRLFDAVNTKDVIEMIITMNIDGRWSIRWTL